MTAATAFFGKTYGETMALLAEARAYLASSESRARNVSTPLDRMRLCVETMRLTARLTAAMAWLLTQRAVLAGELSRKDANGDASPMAEAAACMDGPDLPATAPARLRDLVDRSRRLYVRVARLDALARRSASETPPIS